MNADDFEAELQSRPQRQLPPEWRAEILHAATAAACSEGAPALEPALQVDREPPIPHPCHPERSAGGQAGGAQSKDPVAIASGSDRARRTKPFSVPSGIRTLREVLQLRAPRPITSTMWCWGSLAAVWVLIGLLNFSRPQREPQGVQAAAPSVDWAKQWQENQRMVAELLQPPTAAPLEPRRRGNPTAAPPLWQPPGRMQDTPARLTHPASPMEPPFAKSPLRSPKSKPKLSWAGSLAEETRMAFGLALYPGRARRRL
jgi:hypothetical protein